MTSHVDNHLTITSSQQCARFSAVSLWESGGYGTGAWILAPGAFHVFDRVCELSRCAIPTIRHLSDWNFILNLLCQMQKQSDKSASDNNFVMIALGSFFELSKLCYLQNLH